MNPRITQPPKYKTIHLNGCIFPFRTDKEMHVLFNLSDQSQQYYVVVFDEDKVDELHDIMTKYGEGIEYIIKQVSDEKEFAQSLDEVGVKIAYNPYTVDTPNGIATKWIEPLSPRSN